MDLIKIVLLVFTLYYFFCFFKILYFYSYSIKKWKSTISKVIHISKVQHEGLAIDDTGWRNEIKYSYFVDGVYYESNNITKNLTILLPFAEWVEERFLPFRLNDEIEIKYNPLKPSESVLDTKFSNNNFIYLVIALILTIIIVT